MSRRHTLDSRTSSQDVTTTAMAYGRVYFTAVDSIAHSLQGQ
jgi:hypothetical protein